MWLLPSRRRLANLGRFFEAFKATGGSTPGMVLLGPSDRAAGAPVDYPALPFGWTYRFCAGERQGEKLAEVWDTVKSCTWLGLIGDDCVPETQGWDKRMVNALDGANMVSCDDSWQAPKRVGNCWIMAGDLVRAVGYIFPPRMQHLFVDDVWETIGREAACWRILMDVKVAHRHVLKGEAAADDTHRTVYGSDTSDPRAGMWPDDIEAYETWKTGDRTPIVEAVKALRQERGLVVANDNARTAEIQRQINARLKTRSVLICTPSAHPKLAYAKALWATKSVMCDMGIKADLLTTEGSSNLPKARNALVAHFLARPEYTDLVFIDDDMGWEPMSLLRLLASDKPIIGAVGRKKVDNVEWCCRVLPGNGGLLDGPMSSLEVESVGCGMLKITREAFEQMIAARPDLKLPAGEDMPPQTHDHLYRFFRFGDKDEGEDYSFCWLYRSVGGRIYIDPKIALNHVGDKDFEGCIGDSMTVVPAPLSEAA